MLFEVSGRQDAPGGTRPAPITPGVSVGSGLQLMIAAATASIVDAGRRGNVADAETIHRFRVGVRRLRSILSLFRKVLPEADRRNFGAALAAEAHRYARVREWDVLKLRFITPLVAAHPDEGGLRELEELADLARRTALPSGASIAASSAILVRTLADHPWLAAPSDLHRGTWNGPLHDFAVRLLNKRHRRLHHHLGCLDLDNRPAFHKVRVSAKKIRYPFELLREIFNADDIGAYVDRLVAVQEVLGHLNDVFAAQELLDELPLTARARHFTNAWLSTETAMCHEKIPVAAERFRAIDPFWVA